MYIYVNVHTCLRTQTHTHAHTHTRTHTYIYTYIWYTSIRLRSVHMIGTATRSRATRWWLSSLKSSSSPARLSGGHRARGKVVILPSQKNGWSWWKRKFGRCWKRKLGVILWSMTCQHGEWGWNMTCLWTSDSCSAHGPRIEMSGGRVPICGRCRKAM